MASIALDMDGVIADVYRQFFDLDERDFGRRRTPGEVNGVAERQSFPNIDQYVHEKGFFRNVPLIDGAIPVIDELNAQYDLFIVSAAMEFPASLPEKREWLAEHLPFIQWQQIVFCGSKSIIKTDIMIDDHFRNLDNFTGATTLLFTQPHNINTDPGRHRRVNNWQDIAKLLL